MLATAGSMLSGIGSLLCWNPTAPTTCQSRREAILPESENITKVK